MFKDYIVKQKLPESIQCEYEKALPNNVAAVSQKIKRQCFEQPLNKDVGNHI